MQHVVRLNSQTDFENFMNDNKDWYHRMSFEKIKENFYGDSLESLELIEFKFNNENEEDLILSVTSEDIDMNLSYTLAYFEDIEDYEMCSEVRDLINNVKIIENAKEV